MADNYHHGNLRQALIDAGIKIINEQGEEGLSLRKVAAICGVSHAAPYAHFQSKEELVDAIKSNVTDSFTISLRESLKKASSNTKEESIVILGKCYVKFFIEHPDYYHFLFFRQKIKANMNPECMDEDDYPPFILLKSLYLDYLKEKEIVKSDLEKELELIRIWATVQGISALVCMEGVKTTKPWEEYIDNLIT